ncbi:polysaccharide biosynthesis tyrosine autokinase [Akkermansiaceae bacterium]|nr:polysaccharide biosynthesis tyrosine autokinase [Akkermansiaceae bacterium]
MQSESINQNDASLHAIDYWQVLKNRYGVIILTFLLVFLTAFVITSVMPKKYQSRALVEVRPIQSLSATVSTTGGLGGGMTRQFMMTQFEVIKAAKTLEVAIDKIQLTERWDVDKDQAIAILQSIVKTNQVRGTDLIEISAKHKNRVDAQAVVAAVYAAYEDRRGELEMSQRSGQLAAIKAELQGKTDRVAELNKRLLDIAEQTGIVFIETESGPQTQGVNGLVDLSQTELYQLEKEAQDISGRLTKLIDVEDDDLISVASTLPDVGFTTAYNALEAIKTDFISIKSSGLGAKHPTISSYQTRIDKMTSDLAKRAEQLRDSLSFQLESLQSSVVNMRENVNEQRTKSTATARETQEFNNARKQYLSESLIKDQMQMKYDFEKSSLSMPVTNIIVHESPTVGNNPVSPNVPLNLGLGLVVGLIFGVGIAFALELLDTSVKSIEDVENFLKVPVLAVIPKDMGILHKQSGMSPDSEAYRILRTNIEFNRKNIDDNAITVVSGGAGEGKSTTLVNLAYICAQGGYSTLMIDADLRRPRLHTFFDINNSVGLTNYLTTELSLEDVVLKTPVDNLFFMPSGILPTDAAGILNSRRMSELIQNVKERFDLVLVDSPPILGVSDASVISSEVDLTMIVVQHRKLPRNMLIRVKQAVENVGGHVMGVVLNNVDIRSDSQYQYYTSYYTYYTPTGEEEASSSSSVASSVTKPSESSKETKGGDLY